MYEYFRAFIQQRGRWDILAVLVEVTCQIFTLRPLPIISLFWCRLLWGAEIDLNVFQGLFLYAMAVSTGCANY